LLLVMYILTRDHKILIFGELLCSVLSLPVVMDVFVG